MAEKMTTVSGIQFSLEEKEILSETRIIRKNGIETVRPKYLSFPDAVKESFRLFAKSIGTTANVDYRRGGYSDLCKAFEIHNRLMHPNSPLKKSVE
jgi:hypothetical protein